MDRELTSSQQAERNAVSGRCVRRLKKTSRLKTETDLVLKFWGVRGSTPTPHAENLGFGGNTPCIEIRSGNDIVVIDAGTGLRMLGRALMEEFAPNPVSLHLLLSHFHWDHIQGLPFFNPAYNPVNDLRIYSGATNGNLQQILEGHMVAPYFPVAFRELAAARGFYDIGHKEPARIGSLTIHSFPLNHPQGAAGYRIESPQGVVVYASDLEHGNAKLDATLRDFATGADVLIFDAMYTPEEYDSHKGWGHSTWLEGTRVARDARVNQLVLFHHEPWHTDVICEQIVENACEQFANTTGATEGSSIRLAGAAVPSIVSGA